MRSNSFKEKGWKQPSQDVVLVLVECGQSSIHPGHATPPASAGVPSVVTSKPANGGHLKTGQRASPRTRTCFTLPAAI